MSGFLLALQFLTVIPIGIKLKADKKQLPEALIYFPLVGLLLGLILAGINKLLLPLALGEFLASAILVVLLVVLTGGLHLDGLADTFDALSSAKTRPKMLEIMRDSHIGTMGALSLICMILLKLALLCSLSPKVVNIALVLICLLSRFALVLTIYLFPYARQEGKAKAFFAGMNLKIFTLATAITLFCVILFWSLKGLIVFLAAGVFAALMGWLITKKIGGLTGDTLGAINELTEVFVLLNILILTRI